MTTSRKDWEITKLMDTMRNLLKSSTKLAKEERESFDKSVIYHQKKVRARNSTSESIQKARERLIASVIRTQATLASRDAIRGVFEKRLPNGASVREWDEIGLPKKFS